MSRKLLVQILDDNLTEMSELCIMLVGHLMSLSQWNLLEEGLLAVYVPNFA
jgi:hypothetical protein